MSSTTTIKRKGVFGSRKVVEGTFAASAASSFELATGLNRVEFISLQTTGTAFGASGAAVVNETIPLSSGNVTVMIASGATATEGMFQAIGK